MFSSTFWALAVCLRAKGGSPGMVMVLKVWWGLKQALESSGGVGDMGKS